jgi:thiol-disulfide isomerase/thioredoxin
MAAQRGGVRTDFEFQVYQGADVLGGSSLRLSDVAGVGTPVVLNFWAGDCPPCRFEMPDLQRSHERHQGDVLFLGMDVGVYTGLGSPRSAMALMDELDVTYPVGSPPDRRAVDGYSVRAMPTTVFLEADGGVFERWEGAINESQLEVILSKILQ